MKGNITREITRLFWRSMLSFLPAVLLSTSVAGQDNSFSEYKFKAVYIYNFLQFVHWPEAHFKHDSSPIAVAVLGNRLLDTLLLQTVNDEKIKGHPVIVQSISNPDDVPDCHVLFVSRSEQKNFERILREIRKKPVLVIGESNGFAQSGGSINFYFDRNKLRFEVNLDALRESGLVVSSKLLRLAKIVERGN